MLYVLLTYLCWPLLRLAPRRRAAAPPRRYLVVQAAKIGDLVYATPLWRAIRAAHPGAHVALLAHPAAAALAIVSAVIVSGAPPARASMSDFSPAAIRDRMAAGEAAARKALGGAGGPGRGAPPRGMA